MSDVSGQIRTGDLVVTDRSPKGFMRVVESGGSFIKCEWRSKDGTEVVQHSFARGDLEEG